MGSLLMSDFAKHTVGATECRVRCPLESARPSVRRPHGRMPCRRPEEIPVPTAVAGNDTSPTTVDVEQRPRDVGRWRQASDRDLCSTSRTEMHLAARHPAPTRHVTTSMSSREPTNPICQKQIAHTRRRRSGSRTGPGSRAGARSPSVAADGRPRPDGRVGDRLLRGGAESEHTPAERHSADPEPRPAEHQTPDRVGCPVGA